MKLVRKRAVEEAIKAVTCVMILSAKNAMTIYQTLAIDANKMQFLIKKFVSAIKVLFGILQENIAVLMNVKIAPKKYIENVISVKIIVPIVQKNNFKI